MVRPSLVLFAAATAAHIAQRCSRRWQPGRPAKWGIVAGSKTIPLDRRSYSPSSLIESSTSADGPSCRRRGDGRLLLRLLVSIVSV